MGHRRALPSTPKSQCLDRYNVRENRHMSLWLYQAGRRDSRWWWISMALLKSLTVLDL
jgi:hypothetical protein